MHNEATFEELVRDAEAAAFHGWDFSWLDRRLYEEPRPWDWAAIVRAAFPGARTLLDVGTGGGERLAALVPLPPETWATEGYPPNVHVARAVLEPLGVSVVAADAERVLPFPDGAFDLVIDRHLGCPPAEVARVLRPGGRFITEQVGAGHYREMQDWFTGIIGSELPPGPDAAGMQRGAEAAGLTVTDCRECFPAAHVADVGALVYYLRAIPWVLAGFSLERCEGALRELHRRIGTDGGLRLTGHYCLLQAERPATGASSSHSRPDVPRPVAIAAPARASGRER